MSISTQNRINNEDLSEEHNRVKMEGHGNGHKRYIDIITRAPVLVLVIEGEAMTPV
jgi:hypothetical protein